MALFLILAFLFAAAVLRILRRACWRSTPHKHTAAPSGQDACSTFELPCTIRVSVDEDTCSPELLAFLRANSKTPPQ